MCQRPRKNVAGRHVGDDTNRAGDVRTLIDSPFEVD
jgi:hypothetical protein